VRALRAALVAPHHAVLVRSLAGVVVCAFACALACGVASCERPRAIDRNPPPGGPSAPAEAELPAPADNTDVADDATSSDTSSSGPIAVYFSHTYDNDPAAAAADTSNIDRHVARFIASARRTLDCAFYELASDRVAGALVAAHRRGVRVRIVGDADHRDNAQALRVTAAGIPIVFDERTALMHDKFIVADGDAVWTGSYNVTDNGAFRNNNNAVVIRSHELAENFRTEFEEMFLARRFGPRSPSTTPHTLVKLADADVYNYFSPEDDVPPKIIRIVRAARRSVHVLAFSFTDSTIARELVARRAAGVDVRAVLERRGSAARGSVLAALRSGGVEAFTDANRFVMHHKVIIVDTLWTITGSYNFSSSAAMANDENIVIIKSAPIARRFEEEFGRVRAAALRAATPL
jgi:phosphatidylserine/phosphatidylglycerophosphate/cardiolipin synthase-like enzyme